MVWLLDRSENMVPDCYALQGWVYNWSLLPTIAAEYIPYKFFAVNNFYRICG